MWTALETWPKQLPWQLCKPTLQAACCLWALMVKYETQARLSLACHVHNKHVYLMAECLWFNLWGKQKKHLSRTNRQFRVVLNMTHGCISLILCCFSWTRQYKMSKHIPLMKKLYSHSFNNKYLHNFEHSKIMACSITDCHLEKIHLLLHDDNIMVLFEILWSTK